MTKPAVMPFKLLSLSLCVLLMSPVHAAEKPKLGHTMTAASTSVKAPDFTLEDMDGKKFSLQEYRGKVVLLNFWATWCPPCRREMPSMQRLYEHFKDRNFVVLALNQEEDDDQVFAYLGGLEVYPTFPVLFDKVSQVSHAYGVHGIPTTYLIDKKGNIRFRAIGGREYDHPEVEKLIRKLMRE